MRGLGDAVDGRGRIALGLPGAALDVTLPWAVIPVPAFAAAFWLAPRYRARLRGRAGWRARLSVFLDASEQVTARAAGCLRLGVR